MVTNMNNIQHWWPFFEHKWKCILYTQISDTVLIHSNILKKFINAVYSFIHSFSITAKSWSGSEWIRSQSQELQVQGRNTPFHPMQGTMHTHPHTHSHLRAIQYSQFTHLNCCFVLFLFKEIQGKSQHRQYPKLMITMATLELWSWMLLTVPPCHP